MAILKRTNGEIIAQDPDKTIRQLVMEHKYYLAYADLSCCDLHGLDLSYAHLEGARLGKACLDDANLHGACMHRTDLEHASLLRADMSRADLRHASLGDATFHDARLNQADLTDALVYGTDFFTAGLRGAILTGVCIGHADFTSSDLTDAILPTRSILAQAHAMAPDAGPDEDISLDWSAAGNDDRGALLAHIWEAWLCMDGIEGYVDESGTRESRWPWYDEYTLSIPRDPSADPDNPDDDAPTGSILITVDGWDLGLAVAIHTDTMDEWALELDGDHKTTYIADHIVGRLDVNRLFSAPEAPAAAADGPAAGPTTADPGMGI